MNNQHTPTRTDKIITTITSWIAGAVLLILLIWGGITLWTLNTYEETNDAQVQEYINPITARVGGYISAIR